jgi:DNA-binding cell septation regulator SpoVG
MDITVVRFNPYNGTGKTKAFADVKFTTSECEFVVHDITWVEHDGRNFAGMPSKKAKDGKYYPTFELDKTSQVELNKAMAKAASGGKPIFTPKKAKTETDVEGDPFA